MSLAEQLIAIPEREKSGSDTASRYEFQTLWGLALLFEHHATATDYAIVFEFHDDVALFDDPLNPEHVRFYQVKTKGTPGGWNLTKLLERKKVKVGESVSHKPSFVDRMYDNVEKFAERVLSVDFVSNQPCAFNATKTKFQFTECGPETFEKIVKSVQEAFPLATHAGVGLLGFKQTDLSLADAVAHTKGKLHEFVIEHLGDVTFNLETLYKAIVDDCRRKSSFTGTYSNFPQVVTDKGITKNDVQDWLNAVAVDKRAPAWSDIAPMLSGYGYLEIVQIGRQYDIYRSAALNVGDTAIHRVRNSIRRALESLSTSTSDSLCDIIAGTFPKCLFAAQKYLTPFSDEKLKAMIIYEIHANN